MDDDEGEGQEDPEREHEHGSHQVDNVVPANNGLSSSLMSFLFFYRVTHVVGKKPPDNFCIIQGDSSLVSIVFAYLSSLYMKQS